jgi:exodeoxyribonuclease VII large subunit
MRGEPVIVSVSDAVALINQTLDFAYPVLVVVGELANYQLAKGRWLYADIKDETAKVRLFGTASMVQTPLVDGMLVEIVARPQLHPLYGFSLQLQSIRPVGEGSIKKSATLLEQKLEQEGLFAPERKRTVPYPPRRIGLIASGESAAYADFIKVTGARWQDVAIEHYEVHVQGDSAVGDITAAIQYFNQQAEPVEALVLIRGGGSADDLAAFSTETVVRAVAGSRIPTVVAVGHEIDLSLAERAADVAASTPSNAAELVFPDKQEVARALKAMQKEVLSAVRTRIEQRQAAVQLQANRLAEVVTMRLKNYELTLTHMRALLSATHPTAALARGFALVTHNGKLVRSSSDVAEHDELQLRLQKGSLGAVVRKVY